MKTIFKEAFKGLLITANLVSLLLAGYCWLYFRQLERKSLTRYNEYIEETNSEIAQHWSEFQKDLKLAMDVDLYGLHTWKSDAGTFLNSKLVWRKGTETILKNGFELPSQLPQALVSAFQSDGTEWLDYFDDAQLLLVDSSWLAQLAEYDHWRISKESPLADYLSKNPNLNPLDGPRPDVSPLRAWLRLYLLKGIKEKTPNIALKNARQIVRLYYSTESYSINLMSLDLLRDIAQLYQKAPQHGVTLAPQLQITLEQVEQLRRMFIAYPSLLSLVADSKFLAQIKKPVGLCSLFDESGIYQAVFYEPILYPELPGYFEGVSRLLLRHKECELSEIRRIWNNENFNRVKVGSFFRNLNHPAARLLSPFFSRVEQLVQRFGLDANRLFQLDRLRAILAHLVIVDDNKNPWRLYPSNP